MNLALGDILEDVAPNVGDSGISLVTDRQGAVNAVNRATRLLIYRLDAKGTVWPRCVDVCQEVFALPPEMEEVRSVMINGVGATQREAGFESNANIGEHWSHHCHGNELVDLGDGWALPTLLPQVADGHLAFTGIDEDAGKTLSVRVLNRHNQWVDEEITILNDGRMALTVMDCYDMQFCRKPPTKGSVNVYYVLSDGSYTLQAIYAPKVTAPSYRRKRIPKRHGPGHINRVKLLGKLRYLQVQEDSDQLLIGNLDAVIWGVKAITAQTIGDVTAFRDFVQLAVNELQQELRNEESEATVAPIQVSTGVSFNNRRGHGRHWH